MLPEDTVAEKGGTSFKDRVPSIPEGMSFEAALAEQGVVIVPGEAAEAVVGAALAGTLPPKERRLTELLAERCAAYLSFATVTDDIEDHDYRRGWRERMTDAFGGAALVLYDNRLRTNRMAPALSLADQLKTGLAVLPERSPAVAALLAAIGALEASMSPKEPSDDPNAFSLEYKTLTKEKKLAKVGEISEAARLVLAAAAAEEEEFSKAA